MKNLENYGVQEMNAKEIREIEGGGWKAVLLGVIVGLMSDAGYFLEQSGFNHQGANK